MWPGKALITYTVMALYCLKFSIAWPDRERCQAASHQMRMGFGGNPGILLSKSPLHPLVNTSLVHTDCFLNLPVLMFLKWTIASIKHQATSKPVRTIDRMSSLRRDNVLSEATSAISLLLLRSPDELQSMLSLHSNFIIYIYFLKATSWGCLRSSKTEVAIILVISCKSFFLVTASLRIRAKKSAPMIDYLDI